MADAAPCDAADLSTPNLPCKVWTPVPYPSGSGAPFDDTCYWACAGPVIPLPQYCNRYTGIFCAAEFDVAGLTSTGQPIPRSGFERTMDKVVGALAIPVATVIGGPFIGAAAAAGRASVRATMDIPDLSKVLGFSSVATPFVPGATTMFEGISDFFSDVGDFFTGGATTLGDIGSDIWGGVQSLIPTAISAAPVIAGLVAGPPRAAAPAPRAAAPAPMNPLQYLLPEFMRTPGTGEQSYTGGQPAGQWERDTLGEPGTMGGGVAMAGALVPIAAGMGRQALVATVNAMRSQGFRATVSWLVSQIKKFGPTAAVGFVAGYAGEELASRAVLEAYTVRGRRINPGNVHALRRSMRRLQSFDKLACRVQTQLYGGSQTRGRRRRCGKCRKSPCKC